MDLNSLRKNWQRWSAQEKKPKEEKPEPAPEPPQDRNPFLFYRRGEAYAAEEAAYRERLEKNAKTLQKKLDEALSFFP